MPWHRRLPRPSWAGLFCSTVPLACALWGTPLQAEPAPWDAFIHGALTAHDDDTFRKAEEMLQRWEASNNLQEVRDPLRLIWGLVRLATFYGHRASWAKARVYQARALSLLEHREGTAGLILLAAPLTALADIWLAQGHLFQARYLLERALDIVVHVSDPTSLMRVGILEKLAKISTLQNHTKQALAYHTMVADIQENALPPDTAGYAVVLARMARHHQEAGHNTQALSLFRQARDILMQVSGPYHAARADILTQLALLEARALTEERADPARAIDALKGALAISENMKGHRHPDLLPILKHLVDIHQRTGKPDQSRPLIVRMVSLTEALYGPDHVVTARALLALAHNLQMENQTEPALRLYTRALAVFRHHRPPDAAMPSPHDAPHGSQTVQAKLDMAYALMGSANLLHAQGKLSIAVRHHQEALVHLVDALGPDHPETLTARDRQNTLLKEHEKVTATISPDAIESVQHARRIQERVLSLDEHPSPEPGSPPLGPIGLQPTATPKANHTTPERHFGLPPSTTATKQMLDKLLPNTLLPVPALRPQARPEPDR